MAEYSVDGRDSERCAGAVDKQPSQWQSNAEKAKHVSQVIQTTATYNVQ